MKDKKLKFGGFVPTEGLTNGTEAAVGAGNVLVDMFSKPNQFGRESGISTGLKRGLSLASAGASIGGPLGAGVGAVLGIGSGLLGSRSARKKEEFLMNRVNANGIRTSEANGLHFLRSNPDALDGDQDAQFFKFGGQMSPLASGAAEVVGPSHENGGVTLPNGAEVEGGETISGNYVFSKELGFAQQHKPIAKAISKIQDKRPTTVRKNSLHALQQREQDLALQQESVKQYLGL